MQYLWKLWDIPLNSVSQCLWGTKRIYGTGPITILEKSIRDFWRHAEDFAHRGKSYYGFPFCIFSSWWKLTRPTTVLIEKVKCESNKIQVKINCFEVLILVNKTGKRRKGKIAYLWLGNSKRFVLLEVIMLQLGKLHWRFSQDYLKGLEQLLTLRPLPVALKDVAHQRKKQHLLIFSFF